MKTGRMGFALIVVFFCVAVVGARPSLANGCGCGGPVHTCGGPAPHCGGPSHGCYAPPPIYIHSHCHPGCRHCAKPNRDRGASRDAGAQTRASAPVPIVTSMPVFSSPLMMASVPVMPTTRVAMPQQRSSYDCERRLDRLEDNIKDITNAVAELQTIVKDQTRALTAITQKIEQMNK